MPTFLRVSLRRLFVVSRYIFDLIFNHAKYTLLRAFVRVFQFKLSVSRFRDGVIRGAVTLHVFPTRDAHVRHEWIRFMVGRGFHRDPNSYTTLAAP